LKSVGSSSRNSRKKELAYSSRVIRKCVHATRVGGDTLVEERKTACMITKCLQVRGGYFCMALIENKLSGGWLESEILLKQDSRHIITCNMI
jgi:hypothetical protein